MRRPPARVNRTRASATGDSRPTSVSLSVTTTTTSPVLSSVARKATSRSDVRSAHCTSSSTTTIGRSVLASTSCCRTPSNCANRSDESVLSVVVSSRPRSRRICRHGHSGGAPLSSWHRPNATAAPDRFAAETTSSASRVLPTPGSPVISANLGLSPSRISSTSPILPTNPRVSGRAGAVVAGAGTYTSSFRSSTRRYALSRSGPGSMPSSSSRWVRARSYRGARRPDAPPERARAPADYGNALAKATASRAPRDRRSSRGCARAA